MSAGMNSSFQAPRKTRKNPQSLGEGAALSCQINDLDALNPRPVPGVAKIPETLKCHGTICSQSRNFLLIHTKTASSCTRGGLSWTLGAISSWKEWNFHSTEWRIAVPGSVGENPWTRFKECGRGAGFGDLKILFHP